MKGSTALRWHAAELIAAELAEGKSQRQLAREIGKDPMHVNRCNKMWQQNAAVDPGLRIPFNTAYQAAKQPKNPKPSDDGIPHRAGPGAEGR